MYKVDVKGKRLIELAPKRLSELGMKERFDVQEWLEKSPGILGEDLLIIGKEHALPSGIRLDLLAIDKRANLVVVELKRDESGPSVEWQAIKYASYCSNFTATDIFDLYAAYLGTDADDAQIRIEQFIEEEPERLNEGQRIILVAREFHSDVVSAVLWLRDFEVEIKCVRLRSYVDDEGSLFITPDVIIPLPEARDYVERREVKQKEARRPVRTIFSLERRSLALPELEQKWRETLARPGNLTPRFVAFVDLLLSEGRKFSREEVKDWLFGRGIGEDLGQAGRYLSNLSQFLTKKSNPHLRQVIEFASGGEQGETKGDYRVLDV
ncbi:MAG: hypothetical protein JWN86_3932 [Planctomycetota bacterium]|nr:hypothetical protein [Planctomycetota bacterium]